jgi:hypothetical protein
MVGLPLLVIVIVPKFERTKITSVLENIKDMAKFRPSEVAETKLQDKSPNQPRSLYITLESSLNYHGVMNLVGINQFLK